MMRYVKPHPVIDAVRKKYGIDPSQHSRRREVVELRQALMVALSRKYTLHETGKMFRFVKRVNGEEKLKHYDHSTVHHAKRLHEHRWREYPADRLAYDRYYCEAYEFIIEYMGDEVPRYITHHEAEEAVKSAQRRITEMAEELAATEERHRESIKELERTIVRLTRELAHERKAHEKKKRAFKALYDEKKAREEKQTA